MGATAADFIALLQMKELRAGREYTAEQCQYQLQLLEASETQAHTPLPPERSSEIQPRRTRIRQTEGP